MKIWSRTRVRESIKDKKKKEKKKASTQDFITKIQELLKEYMNPEKLSVYIMVHAP